MTLLEAIVSAGITVMVLGTAASVWIAGATSWYRGLGKIDAEGQSRTAVRTVSDEVARAMDVIVDPDGKGFTFHQPKKDSNGTYMIDVTGQPVADGVDRRIYVQNGKLYYNDGGGIRVLAKNVILTDPLSPGGNQPYKPFVPGLGAITRQLTVMIVTKTTASGKEQVTGRKRETVFLRNIYDTQR